MLTFIESPLFGKFLPLYLNEEEYAELQWHLALSPDAGDIIRGGGGIRKLRWAAKGKGKRGGVRIIYYWHDEEGEEIWLLTLYAKNEDDTLPTALLRKLREQFE